MATPVKSGSMTLLVNRVAGAVSVNTVGIKNSYLVPAGRVARVLWISSMLTGGVAGTLLTQIIVAGVTLTIQSLTVAGALSCQIWLAAGDTVQQNCSVLGAVGVMDMVISLEEWEAL